MQFGFLGVNFKKAPLDIRDKVSFTDGKKLEFLQKAAAVGAEQCLVLSTCNRSEVYYLYGGEEPGKAGGEGTVQAGDKDGGPAGDKGRSQAGELEKKRVQESIGREMREVYKGMFPEVGLEG